jgi:tetratricopeptide (TPR) repeat protein
VPVEKKIEIGQKSYQAEDVYIVLALEYERSKQYKLARIEYESLFKASKKKHYLLKAIKQSLLMNDVDYAKKLADNLTINDITNFRLKDKIYFYKVLSEIHIKQNHTKDAIVYLEKLLDYEQNEKIYEMLSNIYFIQKDYKKSILYLEKAYSFSHSEHILSKIVSIFYSNLNEKKKAISYLESHIRLYQFSKFLADKLLRIYAEDVNIDGMINVYKALYENKEEGFDVSVLKKLYVDKIVQLYLMKNDINSLISFMESNKIFDDRLLEAYHMNHQTIKARDLAKNLYFETKDSQMLAKWAVFDYETTENKTKNFIVDVVTRLENALKDYKSATFYNYLGYLLIDHEIDIENGIKWVEKSIEINSQSPFYLDSLAWGFYKLKDYKKAYEIMKKVVDSLGLKDEEIKKHWELIKSKHKD